MIAFNDCLLQTFSNDWFQWLPSTDSRSPFVDIIAGLVPVNVIVTFRISKESTENFTYEGKRYTDKSEMVISLKRLEAFQIALCIVEQSEILNLLGTKVSAIWPIGVVSGSCKSSHQSQSPHCNSSSNPDEESSAEMLLPVETLGAHYIIPKIPIRYLRAEAFVKFKKPTTLTIVPDTGTKSSYNFTDFGRVNTIDDAVSIRSTENSTFEVYITTYSKCSNELYGDVAMSLVLPVEFFYSKYLFYVPPIDEDSSRFLFIIISYLYIQEFRLDGEQPGGAGWANLSRDLNYSQGTYAISSGVHEAKTTGEKTFGCYIYGHGRNYAFMHPAGIAYMSTECISSLGTMKEDDGIDNDCDGYSDEEVNDKTDNDLDGLVDEDVGNGEIQNCAGDSICNADLKICPEGCLPGFFGPCCSLLENNCADNLACHINNKTCPNGCLIGYTGDCCLEVESHCLNNETCDPVNKTCPTGCQEGYQGECCLHVLNNCVDESECNEHNRTCPSGCLEGFVGDCCLNLENNCASDLLCDPVNKTCPSGCKDGYFRDCCLKVENNCASDLLCDPVNKTCPSGCKDGFFGDCCLKAINNCAHDDDCDVHNRTCPNGCLPGFVGNCCLNLENNCASDLLCDPMNKTCPSGCKDGYFGDCCLKACPENCLSDCNIITGECTACRRKYFDSYCKRRCSPGCKNNTCDQLVGTCQCEEGYYGPMCLQSGLPYKYGWTCHCANGNCSEVDGNCQNTNRCLKGWFSFSCQYIDKAPEADLGDMDNVQLLTDNDDSTCVNVTNNTIQATWSEVFTSSWFLLVFDKK
ncbi:multiple epidermal growth factor-like domains protein 10, partial [Biomphalaria glabrata]